MKSKKINTDLVPVFIPSLASVFMRHELDEGRPLTENEVIAIRQGSIAVELSRSEALRLEDRRGYKDVDPARCWETWRNLRNKMKPKQKI
jgi:hypothetical protein